MLFCLCVFAEVQKSVDAPDEEEELRISAQLPKKVPIYSYACAASAHTFHDGLCTKFTLINVLSNICQLIGLCVAIFNALLMCCVLFCRANHLEIREIY